MAVHGIRLCGCLLQLDILEAEDSLEICELVFLENKAISHAAGEFAVAYLFSEDFMAQAKQARVPKGEQSPCPSEVIHGRCSFSCLSVVATCEYVSSIKFRARIFHYYCNLVAY